MKGRLKRHNAKFKKKIKAHRGTRKTYGRKKKSHGKRRTGRGSKSSGAPKLDIGTGAQLFAKKNVTIFKSRLSGTKRLLKEVKANEQICRQRITAISPYRNTLTPPNSKIGSLLFPEKGGGALWLYNAYNGTTAIEYTPFYMVDLTSCLNTDGTVGFTSYAPVKRLVFGDVAGIPTAAQFLNCTTQDNTGVADSALTWQLEHAGTIAPERQAYPQPKSMLRKTDIDLFFYGAANFATEFCIQVVKLKDDWLHPDEIQNNSVVTSPYTANVLAFYEWYAKAYNAHPLSELDPTQARHLKVLYEKKFTLQQVSSTEGSYTDINGVMFPITQTFGAGNTALQSIGHNQRVKITMPWDKMIDFSWAQNQAMTQTQMTPGASVTQISQNKATCRPKDRVYLVIRALKPTTDVLFAGTGGAVNIATNTTPSFDMKLRNTWVNIL